MKCLCNRFGLEIPRGLSGENFAKGLGSSVKCQENVLKSSSLTSFCSLMQLLRGDFPVALTRVSRNK